MELKSLLPLGERFKSFYKENIELLYNEGIISSKKMYRENMLSNVLSNVIESIIAVDVMKNYKITLSHIDYYEFKDFDYRSQATKIVRKYYFKEEISKPPETVYEYDIEIRAIEKMIDEVFK